MRVLLFTGKGGVGKTSLAVATALAVEDKRWGRRRNPDGKLAPDVVAFNGSAGLVTVRVRRQESDQVPSVEWFDLGVRPGTFVAMPKEPSPVEVKETTDSDAPLVAEWKRYRAAFEQHLDDMRVELADVEMMIRAHSDMKP